MYDFALIVPCFNEGRRLEATQQALLSYFQQTTYWHNKKVAIVFINDGSSDASDDVLNILPQSVSSQVTWSFVSYSVNQGKGGALQQGVASVDAQAYGFIDADLAFPLHFIQEMHQELRAADLVVGSRKQPAATSVYSRFRSWISRSLKKCTHLFLGIPVADTQCGLKVFSAAVAHQIFPQLTKKRFSFDVELIILATQSGKRIVEHPVTYQHDGASSVKMRDGIKYIVDVIGLLDQYAAPARPFFFFGLLGIALAISFVIFGWVLRDGYFFSDDFTWLWHGYKIAGDWSNILSFRMSSFYSPVLNAFYTFLLPIFAFRAELYFLVGILLHAAAAFLAGVFSYQLTRHRVAAVVSTMLFAVAGGAYEPLVWIGANMHSIATFFVLLSLVFFSAALTATRWRPALYFLLSFAALVLALGTKEIAIVTPVLLFGAAIVILLRTRALPFSSRLLMTVFFLASGSVGLWYAWQQYVWQSQSVWLSSGTWKLDPHSLLRFPLVIVDMLLPIHQWVNENTARNFLIGSSVILLYIVWRYRKERTVFYGLCVTIVALLPVIFFTPTNWWDPLASRYTYLARLGIALIIGSIFSYHVIYNKSRHAIHFFSILLIVASVLQVRNMMAITDQDYRYVYASGRTLNQTVDEIAQRSPSRVFVDYNRPFTQNHAHIVGILEVLAHIPESHIIFLEKNEPAKLDYNDVFLYWDGKQESYAWKIKQKSLTE